MLVESTTLRRSPRSLQRATKPSLTSRSTARVTLSGSTVALSDVAVSINQAPMDESLLGMSFLRRLKSFEVQGRRLYLRWQ